MQKCEGGGGQKRNATSIDAPSPLNLCASEGYAHDFECDDRRILDDDCVESILSITSFSSEHFDVAAAPRSQHLHTAYQHVCEFCIHDE